ncbi:MAG: flippase [Nitrospirae bacterium]|nr:flippase [Nitrospirota bacterium]
MLTMIERLLQVARGVVFARMLGPSEYGVYTLALFVVPLVVSFAKLGLPSCYERYVPQYEMKGELGDFFRKNYILSIIASFLVTFLFLIFSKYISEALYDSAHYKYVIILCAVSICPFVLYENILASFNGMRVFKMSALLRLMQAFIFTLFGILFIVVYSNAESTILAYLISFAAVSMVFGRIFWKHVIKSGSQSSVIHDPAFYTKMFRYSVWFIISPAFYTLYSFTDRLVLNHFFGLREVGIYSVSVNITQMVFMVGMIAGTVLMPSLSSMWERGEKNKVMLILNLAIKITVISVLGAAVIFILLKKQIMYILYGNKYLEGLPILTYFLMFWLFNTIVWITGIYPSLIEKPYLVILATAGGFVLNIGLNFILIPQYGLVGAAIATLSSQVLVLLILLLLYRRENMEIKLTTIFICLTPFILLLNNIQMSMAFLFLCIATVMSNYIVTEEEKIVFLQQISKVYEKIKK